MRQRASVVRTDVPQHILEEASRLLSCVDFDHRLQPRTDPSIPSRRPTRLDRIITSPVCQAGCREFHFGGSTGP